MDSGTNSSQGGGFLSHLKTNEQTSAGVQQPPPTQGAILKYRLLPVFNRLEFS